MTCRENPKCRKMDFNSFILAPVQFSQSVRGMYVLCDALEGVLISELFVENLKFERIFFSLYLVG